MTSIQPIRFQDLRSGTTIRQPTVVRQPLQLGPVEIDLGTVADRVTQAILDKLQNKGSTPSIPSGTSTQTLLPQTNCLPGFVFNVSTGKCQPGLGQKPGADDQIGPAVMGRYGAAYVPANRVVNRAVCLSGDLVGDDGLCYPRGAITNRERAWPKGRRPLLTGGEMRAISIAARAGKKFERTQKRLQSLGMVKKPASRRVAPKAHQHLISAPSGS